MHIPPPIPAHSCQESCISCDLSELGNAGLLPIYFPIFCSFPLEVTAAEELWTANLRLPLLQILRSRWGYMWLICIILNRSVSINSQKTHMVFEWTWQNEKKMPWGFSGSQLLMKLTGCSRAHLNAQLKGLIQQKMPVYRNQE